jgi:hypothetical protein
MPGTAVIKILFGIRTSKTKIKAKAYKIAITRIACPVMQNLDSIFWKLEFARRVRRKTL